MIKSFSILLFIVSLPLFAQSQINPCNDSLFSALKRKPLDSLSEREYRYLSDKNAICNQFQLTEALNRQQIKIEQIGNKEPYAGSQINQKSESVKAAAAMIAALSFAVLVLRFFILF
jgi:hypothetical protein